MHIGERIKQRREELHMSMDDLAQKLGYKSRTSIFKIESGDTDLPLSKVEEVAAALFVTPQFLMGWEDNGTQSDVPYYLDEETAEIAQEGGGHDDIQPLSRHPLRRSPAEGEIDHRRAWQQENDAYPHRHLH